MFKSHGLPSASLSSDSTSYFLIIVGGWWHSLHLLDIFRSDGINSHNNCFEVRWRKNGWNQNIMTWWSNKKQQHIRKSISSRANIFRRGIHDKWFLEILHANGHVVDACRLSDFVEITNDGLHLWRLHELRWKCSVWRRSRLTPRRRVVSRNSGHDESLMSRI